MEKNRSDFESEEKQHSRYIEKKEDVEIFFRTFGLVCTDTRSSLVKIFEKAEVFPMSYMEVVMKLIDDGEGWYVAMYFEKFTEIKEENHLKILNALFEKRLGRIGDVIAENFEKFTGIQEEEHENIVKKFINAGFTRGVIENFNKFTGIREEKHLEIMNMLLAYENTNYYIVMRCFEKFTGIPEQEHIKIAKFLIKKGYIVNINEVFRVFPGVGRHNTFEIVQLLVNKYYNEIDDDDYFSIRFLSSLAERKNLQNVNLGNFCLGNVEEVLPEIFKHNEIDIKTLFIDVLHKKTNALLLIKKEFDKAKCYINQEDINKVRALGIVMTQAKKESLRKFIMKNKEKISKEELRNHVEVYASRLTKEFSRYMREILSEDLYDYNSELIGRESEYFVAIQ